MLTITWRTLREHSARFLSTIIAIVLGVGFFVGTGVLTGTVEKSLTNSIAGAYAYADVDVVVRSTETIDADPLELRCQIPASLADQIEQVPGVADAAPNVAGYAQIVGNDGKVLDGQAASISWIDSDLNPFTLVDGQPPAAMTISRLTRSADDSSTVSSASAAPSASSTPTWRLPGDDSR